MYSDYQTRGLYDDNDDIIESARARETISILREENAKLVNKYQDADKNLEEFKILYENLQMNYENLTNENDRQQQEIFDKERIIQKCQNDIVEIQEANYNLIEERDQRIQRLEEINRENRDKIASREEKNNALHLHIENHKESLERSEARNHKLRLKNTSLEEKLRDRDQKNENLEDEVIKQRNLNTQLKLSFDKRLEEETKEFQNEIQESNYNLNQYKLSNNKLQEDYNDLNEIYNKNIQQLKQDHQKQIESQIKLSLEKNTSLEEQLKNQVQENTSLKEAAAKLITVHEEKEKYESLHNGLQEKYRDSVNEYQKIVQKSENDIKDIEERHIRDVQQLEQDHKSKIELHEGRIVQLQSALKENTNLEEQLKNLVQENASLKEDVANLRSVNEKEKKIIQSDADEYKSLYESLQEKYTIESKEKNQSQIIIQEKLNAKYNNLQKQFEDLVQQNFLLKVEKEEAQSAIEVATNFSINDNEQSNNDKLNKDILALQITLDNYVTNLKSKIEINVNEAKKLLTEYGCKIEISDNEPNKPLIRAVLQRHVLEEILNKTESYFKCPDEDEQYLESKIVSQTIVLNNLIKKFQNDRIGDNELTRLTMARLRQQVYSVLGARGFNNSENSKHGFIEEVSLRINEIINKYRKIEDAEMREYVDSLAEDLVRNVIRIFYFRLSIHEPIAQYRWFKNNEIINKSFMKGNWNDDDSDDNTVEVCLFPLIYKPDGFKIITPAKVFPSNIITEKKL